MAQSQQTIRSTLKTRAAPPATCRAGDTVQAAVELLNRLKIGALPVTDGDGRLVGILSERDVIRGLAENKDAVLASAVESLMTRDVAICSPETRVETAALLMITHHIRHLPVVEGGRVVNIVSLRDVMAHRLAEADIDAEVLREAARASGGVSVI